MRKSAIIYLVILLAIFGVSCKEKTTQVVHNQPDRYAEHLAVYKQSLDLKDYQTALVALSYMHQADSSYTQYTDSLIVLYTKAGLYNSTVQLGEKLLEKYPQKDTIRELVAASNTQIGNYQKGYNDFKLLYDKNKHPSNLYNMGKIKYLLREINEAEQLFNRIIKDSAARTEMVEFPSQSGAMQAVPLPAGCYMQLANIAADKQDIFGAMALLKKALKISPGFETADYSLKQLEQYQAQVMRQQRLQRQQQQLPGGGFNP